MLKRTPFRSFSKNQVSKFAPKSAPQSTGYKFGSQKLRLNAKAPVLPKSNHRSFNKIQVASSKNRNLRLKSFSSSSMESFNSTFSRKYTPYRPSFWGLALLGAVGYVIYRNVKDAEAKSKELPSNPVYKIVMTGGPCGGKSTALSQISTHLEGLGLHFLFAFGSPFLIELSTPRIQSVHSSRMRNYVDHRRSTSTRTRN